MDDVKREIAALLKDGRDWVMRQPDTDGPPTDAQCDALAGLIERGVSLFKRVQ